MKHPRIKDANYLAWVRGLPCLVCGNNIETEAAHVKYSDSRAAKYSPGMAEKSDDHFAVPLCSKCHRSQHTMNEREWWVEKKIDPITTAAFLCLAYGDQARAEQIIETARISAVSDCLRWDDERR